jgi:hypothetical protein
MSIRAILVTIIGVLLFCAIDFVFGIAIIEFNVVNSSKPEILLPAGKNFGGGWRAIAVWPSSGLNGRPVLVSVPPP